MNLRNRSTISTTVLLLLTLSLRSFAQIPGGSTATGYSTATGTGAVANSYTFQSGKFRWPQKSDLNIKRLESRGFKLVKSEDGSFSLYENIKQNSPAPTTVAGIIDSSTLVSNGLGTGLVFLGLVYVTDAKEFYEWCDKDYHQSWIDAGEISKEDLYESIKEPGQAAGKGYYVSMDPSDSITYGPSLTTFHPQRPVVILEYSNNDQRIYSDTEFVLRLADAGIHALKTPSYRPTWLSVIHTQVLQTPGEMTKQIFDEILTKVALATVKIYLDKDYLIQFLPDDPSVQILERLRKNEALTEADLALAYPLLDASVIENFYSQLQNLVITAQDPKTKLIQLLSNVIPMTGFSSINLSQFIINFSASQKLVEQSAYSDILEEFSLGDLMPLMNSPAHIADFKKLADTIKNRKAKVDFAGFTDAADYTSKFAEIYGNKPNITSAMRGNMDKNNFPTYVSDILAFASERSKNEYIRIMDANYNPSQAEMSSLFSKICEESMFAYFFDPAEPATFHFSSYSWQLDFQTRIYFLSSYQYFGLKQIRYSKGLFKMLATKRQLNYDIPGLFNSLHYSVINSLIQVRLLRDYILLAKDDADFVDRVKNSIEITKKTMPSFIYLDARFSKNP